MFHLSLWHVSWLSIEMPFSKNTDMKVCRQQLISINSRRTTFHSHRQSICCCWFLFISNLICDNCHATDSTTMAHRTQSNSSTSINVLILYYYWCKYHMAMSIDNDEISSLYRDLNDLDKSEFNRLWHEIVACRIMFDECGQCAWRAQQNDVLANAMIFHCTFIDETH